MGKGKVLLALETGMGMYIYDRPTFGCVAWVCAATELDFGAKGKFTVGIAGGYNAGIYGHEGNGVFVGDDRRRDIVITGQCYTPGAQFVPTKAQIELYNKLCSMTWAQFRRWVNGDIEHCPPFVGRRYKI